ncbi:MAG: DUF1573 domain-containing protein [Bacteroidota bacterium]
MKPSFVFIAFVCAVSGLFAQEFYATPASLTFEEEGAAAMSWEMTTMDLGKVEMGTKPEVTFSFVNKGSKALTITRVKTSCSCTASDYTKESIAPGQSGMVKAIYNAKGIGRFTKSVMVYTDAQAEPVILKIMGTVEDLGQEPK